ncbi:MAG: hypothetical protein NVS2B15_09880 [Pseudarthrobacter sp.]
MRDSADTGRPVLYSVLILRFRRQGSFPAPAAELTDCPEIYVPVAASAATAASTVRGATIKPKSA